jgi:hypothetical protein
MYIYTTQYCFGYVHFLSGVVICNGEKLQTMFQSENCFFLARHKLKLPFIMLKEKTTRICMLRHVSLPNKKMIFIKVIIHKGIIF